MNQNTRNPEGALDRFPALIPDAPYASHTKRLGGIKRKEDALKNYKYIQVNTPHRINYIVVDLDYADSADACRARGLPPFNLTAVNPANGHSQGFYELPQPLPVSLASKDAKALLKRVVKGLKEAFRADKVITTQRQLVKNPLHPAWRVWEYPWTLTLTELARALPKKIIEVSVAVKHRNKPFADTLVPGSRNVSLFESARRYSYTVVPCHRSYEPFYSAVLDHLHHLKETEIPLYFSSKPSASEIKQIARSIANWTWERRKNFRVVKEGAMGYEPLKGTLKSPEEHRQEVKKRQQEAGRYAAEQQKNKKEVLIHQAIAQLADEGKKVTKMAIAKKTGLDYGTVRRHLAKK